MEMSNAYDNTDAISVSVLGLTAKKYLWIFLVKLEHAVADDGSYASTLGIKPSLLQQSMVKASQD